MLNKIITWVLLMGFLPISALAATNTTQKIDTAIFAMGCFWHSEAVFRDDSTHKPLEGIINVTVGYAGGETPSPTYASHEGYQEAVKVVYDPSIVPYEQLLTLFWHNIDPFDAYGQFCEKGNSYRTVIYYNSEMQKDAAEASKTAISRERKKPVSTEILPLTTFYEAEDFHQNYKANNPLRYKYYRWRCGCDARLEEIWSNPNK